MLREHGFVLPAAPRLRSPRSPGARQRIALDAAVRIRLFGKLKFTKCARAERRPGHFCVRAEERLFFRCYLQVNKRRFGARSAALRSCKRLSRYAQPLRQLHGSGAVRERVYCFRIVFSMACVPQPCIPAGSFALSSGGYPDEGRTRVVSQRKLRHYPDQRSVCAPRPALR
jgi:hypothetical protein